MADHKLRFFQQLCRKTPRPEVGIHHGNVSSPLLHPPIFHLLTYHHVSRTISPPSFNPYSSLHQHDRFLIAYCEGRAMASAVTRRNLLLLLPSSTHLWHSGQGSLAHATPDVREANIQLELAPNQSLYNAADPELRAAAALLQKVKLSPQMNVQFSISSELHQSSVRRSAITEEGLLTHSALPWINLGSVIAGTECRDGAGTPLSPLHYL